MEAKFDPYYKWLGIAPREQPPNAYRLLAIDLFESDADVIANAADRQMVHLRTFASGPQGAATQAILNEVARAKVVLLNAEKKAAYDQKLRAKLSGATSSAAATQEMPSDASAKTIAKSRERLPMAQPLEQAIPTDVKNTPAVASAMSIQPSSAERSPLVWYALAGVLVVVVGAIAAVMLTSSPNEPATEVAVATSATNKSSEQPITTPQEQLSTTEKRTPTETKSPEGDNPRTQPNPSPSNSDESSIKEKTEPAVSPSDPPLVDPSPSVEQNENVDPTPTAGPAETSGQNSQENSSDPQPELRSEENIGPNTAIGSASEKPNSERPSTKPVKRQVPTAVEDEKARATVRELFQEKINGATKSESKLELARELLDEGRQIKDEPVSRFALWSEAAKWAAESGDAILSLQIVDEMADEFEVDAVSLKADALTTVQKTAKQAEQRVALAQAVAALVDEALASDDFEAAKRWSQVAQTASRGLRDPELNKFVAAQAKAVAERAKAFEAVSDSFTTLDRDPSNAAANLKVGRYLWFVKGDVASALAHLAKGDEAELSQAAADDVASPASPEAQAALADRWWELAEGSKEPEKEALFERASHWYSLALPELNGLAKSRAEKRIAQLSSQPAATEGRGKKKTNAKGVLWVVANEDFQVMLNGKPLVEGSNKPVSVPVVLRVGDVLAARMTDTSYDYGLMALFLSDDRLSAVTSNIHTWKCYVPQKAERWWDFKPAAEHPQAQLGNHISIRMPEADGWGLDAIWGSSRELAYVYHVVDAQELNDAPASQRAVNSGGKLKVKGMLHFAGSDQCDVAINGQPFTAVVNDKKSIPLTVAAGDLITVKVTITQYGRGIRAIFDSDDHKIQFFTHSQTWGLYLPEVPQRWWKMIPRPTDPPAKLSDSMELPQAGDLPCEPIAGPRPTCFLYHVVQKEELQPRKK